MSLILTGDENNDPQALTTAEVNHLRRLLGWLVCEHPVLSDDRLVGMMRGLEMAVRSGVEVERAQAVLDEEVQRAKRVPAYIRQAVKMLQKAIREHEAAAKVVNL